MLTDGMLKLNDTRYTFRGAPKFHHTNRRRGADYLIVALGNYRRNNDKAGIERVRNLLTSLKNYFYKSNDYEYVIETTRALSSDDMAITA